MIRMLIEVSKNDADDGSVNVRVKVDPFRPVEEDRNVGEMWTGICLAINDYMHSRGVVDFDILTERKTVGDN